MAVPTFLAGVLGTDFRYLSFSGVSDTITILNQLNTELTALGWACSVSGSTPSAIGTYTSPTRSDGVSMTITATQVSALVLSFVVKDQWGLLVNNQTTTQLNIDGSPTIEVRLYTNKFGFCVDAIRVTPETFICGILDRTPDTLNACRASYYASAGPRSNTNVLTNQSLDTIFVMGLSATSYAYTTYSLVSKGPSTGGLWSARKTLSGALVCEPVEFMYSPYFLGRMFQALSVDVSIAFGTEVTVPIDVATTGVFKVVGMTSSSAGSLMRLMYRKS